MIWIARLIFVFAFMVALDGLYALLGVLLSNFSYRKHPRLHRVGLRLMAMSTFTCKDVLPRRCELCCGVDKCRNWTCPGQKAYRKTVG